MLTYNMDVEPRSVWLRTTPGTAALTQPFYATEAGDFYGRGHFATARTGKQSYILFYTLEGAGLIEQNEQQLKLARGTALLLDCRTAQSYCTAPGQAQWHHWWVHLDGAGVKSLAEVLLPDGRLTPVHLSRIEAEPLFGAILQFLPQNNVTSQIEVGLALHRLLATMATRRLNGAEEQTNRALIERAAERIQRRYAEPLTLEQIMEGAPVSRGWFMRLFRRYMGTTPYNYLTNTRITRAKELLVTTDCTIAEIAAQVGFADANNFSTRFTSAVGQSPLKYRQSALKPV